MLEVRIFGDLSTRVLECFASDALDEAYALVNRYGGRFPDERWHVDYWRMILSVLVGEGEKANPILKEAVEAGMWWPERYLSQEEFEPYLDTALVATCYSRRDEALARSEPALNLRHPEGVQHPAPLLFVLHRNHTDVDRDGVNWLPVLDLGWGLALPESSQLVGAKTHVWDDRGQALAEIEAHTAALRADGRFDLDQVVTAGYVTGGNLAIRLALQGTLGARGFVALSPFVPDLDDAFLPLLQAGHAKGLRGVITIGERDSRCYAGAVDLADRLRKAGAEVDLRVYPDFTQGYPPNFERLLPEALSFILSRSR
jgi:dienelactone hydrolase